MKISKVLTGAALLTAGYLIGFYEVKCRFMKIMLDDIIDKETNDKKENTEG